MNDTAAEVKQSSLTWPVWPCPQHPGPQAYMDGTCQGNSYTHTHCTACHHIYAGYVALCPMHQAAPEMLRLMQEVDAFEWEAETKDLDIAERTAWFMRSADRWNVILGGMRAVLAKARGRS
jgi:hypothetical protein